MVKRKYGENILDEYQLGDNGIPSQIFTLNSKDEKYSPTIVMVGAHDGVHGEQYGLMNYLEDLNDFELYLIEPVEKFFNQLAEVYEKFGSNVHYLNYAITEKTGEDKMIDQGVMSKIGEGDLKVKTKTWSDFTLENNIKQIDILILDCEGYEYEILKQIDFVKNPIKAIRYEYLWLNKLKRWKLDWFLKKNKYKISLCVNDPKYNKIALLN